jgi:hypothetical protein
MGFDDSVCDSRKQADEICMNVATTLLCLGEHRACRIWDMLPDFSSNRGPSLTTLSIILYKISLYLDNIADEASLFRRVGA